MENKSKLNMILLVIIIILLVVGLFYIVSSNLKQKSDDVKQYPLLETPISTTTTKSTPTPNPTPKPCNITSDTSLEEKYDNFKCQYSLKYETFSNAVNAFKIATDSHMKVSRIDFYVPGKIPREDGNPYFIGNGTVNSSTNDCVVGYMNLVTGVSESHHDVCIIYN